MTLLLCNVCVWEWAAAPGEGSVREASWVTVSARGAITEVGASGSPHPPADSFARVIDGGGQLVLPGLNDAHIHVMGTGESAAFLNLGACDSIPSLQAALERHAALHPPSALPWIQGVHWDQTDLGRMPTRADVDAVCPDRPVFLWRACWHIGLANSAALRLAGVSLERSAAEMGLSGAPEAGGEGREGVGASLPLGVYDAPVEGGCIEMDARGPTGILKERAVEMVTAAMQAKTQQQKESFISTGLRRCLRLGLTSVQTNDEGAMSAYRHLQRTNALPLRVFLTPTYADLGAGTGMVPVVPRCFAYRREGGCEGGEGGGEGSAAGEGRGAEGTEERGAKDRDKRDKNDESKDEDEDDDEGYAGAGSRLVINRVKMFSDGSLGAGTAALRLHGDPHPRPQPHSSQLPNANSSSSSSSSSTSTNDDDDGGGGYTGILIHSPTALALMMTDAREQGWRLEVHAIGDKAAEVVLAAIRASGGGCGANSANSSTGNSSVGNGSVEGGSSGHRRPILTHCQVLGPDLIRDMAALGVIANVQPSFVPTDMRWVRDRLPSAVRPWSYCWRRLMRSGVVVAGGSDSPIETPNPFEGMYDAVFRESRGAAGRVAAGRVREEREEQDQEEDQDEGEQEEEKKGEKDGKRKGKEGGKAGEKEGATEKNDEKEDEDDNNDEDDDEDEDVFLPSERLTFAQALSLYTTNAAAAADAEAHLGRVERGYAADLVLVDGAIVSDPRRLLQCRPRLVLVGGEVAFDALLHGQGQGEGQGAEGGEGHRAEGPFFPGRNGAGCLCCRGGGVGASFGDAGVGARGGAGSAGSGWRDAAWEEAMQSGALADVVSSSDEFCMLVGAGGRGRGRRGGRGRVRVGRIR